MTYVSDAISLLQIVADANVTGLQPVNIGNDIECEVLEIAASYARAAQVDFRTEFLPARDGDPKRRRPDLTFARSLGWSPKVDLKTGLELTISWARRVSPAYI
jgi:nucleoside-diphosphate-sugar epimerase